MKQRLSAGQALVEFVVTLVAVLVLITAILQIGQLGILHSKTLHDAREHAGSLSLLSTRTMASPDFIADWSPGNDGAIYSRDDRSRNDRVDGFDAAIVQSAHPRNLTAHLSGNPVSSLSGDSFPQLQFGLIQARETATQATLPVVRRLFYAADPIEVEGQVWATWAEGIY